MDASSRMHEAAADVHKAMVQQQEDGPQLPRRACTARFDHDKPREEISKLKEPGGFRRHYLNSQADEAGIPDNQRPAAWKSSFVEKVRPLVRSGYFDSILGVRLDPNTGEEMEPEPGTLGQAGCVLALLKCYIGSGITFIPGAFATGGWLFCTVTLVIMGFVNLFCTAMLVDIRQRTGHCGLGDMGQAAVGKLGKRIVQLSLVVSQYGVCIAYMIFTCELGADALKIDRSYILAVQMLMLIPLSLIRTVDKLECPNLLADALIFTGIIVMCGGFCHHMRTYGPAPDFKPFRPTTCGFFVGTAIFSFEGTPLLMPIANSMAEPKHFWGIFVKVFAFVVILFTSFGLIGYGCYGTNADTVILLNLPRGGIAGMTKLIYMIALTLSWALMFLPAIKIVELWMFGIRSKNKDTRWMDASRIAQAIMFALIALLCADAFEKFIAIAGAICAGPIMLIYPPLFHLLLCADTITRQMVDSIFLAAGAAAIIFALTHLDS